MSGRIVFVLVLGGALALWTHLRAPRDLLLDVDLTAVQPGDLSGVDVTVRRDGRALTRLDERYGPSGAPATVHLQLRASPGPVEVEATVVDRAGRARRSRARIELDGGRPSALAIRPD